MAASNAHAWLGVSGRTWRSHAMYRAPVHQRLCRVWAGHRVYDAVPRQPSWNPPLSHSTALHCTTRYPVSLCGTQVTPVASLPQLRYQHGHRLCVLGRGSRREGGGRGRLGEAIQGFAWHVPCRC